MVWRGGMGCIGGWSGRRWPARCRPWCSDDDDADTSALRTTTQQAFQIALNGRGLVVPTTVAELAETLAALGVLERVETAGERTMWRSPEDLPELSATLPLPDSWIAHEDKIRWRVETSLPADTLRRHLRQAGRPQQLQTTIDALAEGLEVSAEQIRDGLDGFLYREWASASRHGHPLNRRELAVLPAHAVFGLDLDWALVGDGEEADEEFDLSGLRWQASPWTIYQAVASDSRVSEGAVRVTAMLPFEVVKPTGGRFLTSLGDLAATEGVSVPKIAEALTQLDDAGLLAWDSRSQRATLRATRHDSVPEGATSPSVERRLANALSTSGDGMTS